jgi:cytochrome c553
MKTKSKRLLLTAALAAAAAGCANLDTSRDLANPQVSAKTMAQQVCALCHGASGRNTNPNFPQLAAQQPAYFKAQMQQFKGHNRLDPAGFEYMWGLSRSLTDAQIDGLATYFAAQSAAPAHVDADAATLARGRAIFEGGVTAKNIPPCSACHGAQAQGNDKFPRLANQHADYLVKQLTVFQRTDERPEGSIMKTIAHDLTRDNMQDVAAYLQAFRAN